MYLKGLVTKVNSAYQKNGYVHPITITEKMYCFRTIIPKLPNKYLMEDQAELLY